MPLGESGPCTLRQDSTMRDILLSSVFSLESFPIIGNSDPVHTLQYHSSDFFPSGPRRKIRYPEGGTFRAPNSVSLIPAKCPGTQWPLRTVVHGWKTLLRIPPAGGGYYWTLPIFRRLSRSGSGRWSKNLLRRGDFLVPPPLLPPCAPGEFGGWKPSAPKPPRRRTARRSG